LLRYSNTLHMSIFLKHNFFTPTDHTILIFIVYSFNTVSLRKVLGYVHIRKGPNKVGFIGILQPFRDAIKLFSKEQTFPLTSNYISYYFAPIFSFFKQALYRLFPCVRICFVHFVFQAIPQIKITHYTEIPTCCANFEPYAFA
ncbi:hypothetical protein L9F63_022366, partial [Diploptera punctata]